MPSTMNIHMSQRFGTMINLHDNGRKLKGRHRIHTIFMYLYGFVVGGLKEILNNFSGFLKACANNELVVAERGTTSFSLALFVVQEAPPSFQIFTANSRQCCHCARKRRYFLRLTTIIRF